MKNVRTFYDCSTSHIPAETAEAMEAGTFPNVTMSGEFGFLVYVPESFDALRDRGVTCSAFFTVLALAQDAGCDYVLFDRDAEPVEYLESFDW